MAKKTTFQWIIEKLQDDEDIISTNIISESPLPHESFRVAQSKSIKDIKKTLSHEMKFDEINPLV